jgi:hypothetical protein
MNYSYCAQAAGRETATEVGALSPYDIYGAQVAYGRKKSGSIVGMRGRCIRSNGVYNGSPLVVTDCYGANNERWDKNREGGGTVFTQVHSSTRWGMSSNNHWQAQVNNFSASGANPENRWLLLNMKWKGVGGLCVGSRPDGKLELQECNGSASQGWNWNAGVNGRIQQYGTNNCVNVWGGAQYPANGTQVGLYPCGNPAWGNEQFVTSAIGEVKYGGKCMQVDGHFPVPGALIKMYACESAANLLLSQIFNITGRIGLEATWTVLGTINQGASNFDPVLLYPVTAGARWQEWDIYFWQ